MVAIAMTVFGCTKKPTNEREVDYSLLDIDTEHLLLRHDTVGHDEWQSEATYALVDVHNRHTEDLMVTLGGAFVDDDGREVGPIHAESLRVPAGGVRMFALVDKERVKRDTATSVKARVLGAYVPNYPPPVQVTQGEVYRYGDRMVVNGMVENTADRPVRAIVIAGFYDSEGNLLKRPFTEMYIPENGQSPAQFVGPTGSVKGYIFVGDMVF